MIIRHNLRWWQPWSYRYFRIFAVLVPSGLRLRLGLLENQEDWGLVLLMDGCISPPQVEGAEHQVP